MATQDFAASIQGVGIRVTRLDAIGNLMNGPGDSYTTAAFMRVSFTPEYEEGDEITEKSANGSVCVAFKAPDTLKRLTMELAICDPDPELTNLVGGGLLLRKNLGSFASPDRKSIGWAAPAIGDDPSGNGVAIEVWSLAIKDGKRSSTLPYWHWIFPYVKLRQSGDRVIENGLLATTFEGFGLGNAEFESGIDERWEYPVATSRPYAYARTTWAPLGLGGFYTWHGDLSSSITNAGITANVAAVTTSAPHSFSVGEQVTIAGAATTAALNGNWIITDVPTSTTFKFAIMAADVTAASETGTATVNAGPVAVTDFDDTGANDAYNVPGNVSYNPDRDIDFIVSSVEDPSV